MTNEDDDSDNLPRRNCNKSIFGTVGTQILCRIQKIQDELTWAKKSYDNLSEGR